jgi:hypothetical protein
MREAEISRPYWQANLCSRLHIPLSYHLVLYEHKASVLVQREMERGGSPLVSIPPCGRGFSRHLGLPIRCGPLQSAEWKHLHRVHLLYEPTGLPPSMVASPQCRFRFARQSHCSAAATSAANFRIAQVYRPTLTIERRSTKTSHPFFLLFEIALRRFLSRSLMSNRVDLRPWP